MKELLQKTATGKYMVLYKCQLCGTVIKLGKPIEARYEKLPVIAGNIIQNRLLQSPSMIPCKCPDGSCGIAYFIGLKPC